MKKRERSSGGATSRFVVDTNVIVSALKTLLREPRAKEGRVTSLSLLVKLIVDPSTELFGNQFLLREYQRFAED
jgi:spore germination protein GerM